MSAPKIQRQENGWAGHFILGYRCAFRRNTMLSMGETRIIISTVGNLPKFKSEGGGAETIGIDRYYETMVFHARKEGPYWHADVSRQINFKSPWALTECKNETDLKADAMHECVVEEISTMLKTGTIPKGE